MIWIIAIAAAWGLAVGGIGAALTRLDGWYYALNKPSWQPPDWAFGPAWTLILALASAAAVFAWQGAAGPDARRLIVILFAANGALNIGWSLCFFTLRRPDWGLIEVVPLWLSVLALVIGLQPSSRLASWLVVPYLLWVAFAAVLNLAIVRLNPAYQRA